MTEREKTGSEVARLEAELRAAREEIERLEDGVCEERVQLQRMAALGMLVSGIMHEIKTPVGAIRSAQDTLARALGQLRDALEQASPGLCAKGGAAARALKAMEDASRVILAGSTRTLEIIHRVRGAARDADGGTAPFDLHQALDETLALLEHEARGRIQILKQYADDVPAVAANRGEIGQVLLNVLLNAVQAVEGEGTIVVRTEAHEGAVHAIVEDTGVGIAPEHLPRIFETGFSTKPEERGSGLGLSISRELIERNGGRIDLTSELGKGTSVTIVLPA